MYFKILTQAAPNSVACQQNTAFAFQHSGTCWVDKEIACLIKRLKEDK